MIIYMKSTTQKSTQKKSRQQTSYPRPKWLPKTITNEQELCPDCFKVVGEKSRYNLVCMLGKSKVGFTVTELTKQASLTQPTITHHLQVLQSVNAVKVEQKGREKFFTLNRGAHCFEDCKIPY